MALNAYKTFLLREAAKRRGRVCTAPGIPTEPLPTTAMGEAGRGGGYEYADGNIVSSARKEAAEELQWGPENPLAA